MPFSIYVGNLPWCTTPEDLRALFEPYGEVENARIITDRETGRSRGFGFVDMVGGGGRPEGHRRVAQLRVGAGPSPSTRRRPDRAVCRPLPPDPTGFRSGFFAPLDANRRLW